MNKYIKCFFTLIFILSAGIINADEPYSIQLEQMTIPGSPKIHSFAFAEYNGKWLFIGGRTNGMHGFDAATAFPEQYSNTNIFVVDPVASQTFSRSLFTDLNSAVASPLRSTNMQYYFDGTKLYIIGGYGYDSLFSDFVTFPKLTVVDVNQVIQAVVNGTSVSPYIRQITDERMRVCGSEIQKIDDYFYMAGGHIFTGAYSNISNDQVYTNEIRRFKINDNGVNVSISDYTSYTDTVEFHRRDMNLVPAIRPDGVSQYIILYGGVFRSYADLPFQNPIYIDANGAVTDYGFEQKMSQYTCANLSAFNSVNGSMHTTFFGGTSLYYYNESLHQQVRDSLVPFINDITTLTKNSNGASVENISPTVMPALLGTNAKFILSSSIPHYSNGVIKLNEISGNTFAGYIFGGIRAYLPNNTPSFPSEYIFRVYINPVPIGIQPVSGNVPESFRLGQNFPNPFNPVTKIKFEVPASGNVRLAVYNSLGNEVAVIADQKMNPGVYQTEFSAEGLSSGVYYYKLTSGNFSETKKMLLLK
ncbi:MAG: T9SS type A sorting domain-containing protein [Bacteroidetes bacterium]|nr:T9SS type A sorting domain-containing protein [Bacteroidota bacterium]